MGRSFAKDRPLACKLRTSRVEDSAAVQIYRGDSLGILAGLVLPEQRRMTKAELALDPVLDFMNVDVHSSYLVTMIPSSTLASSSARSASR